MRPKGFFEGAPTPVSDVRGNIALAPLSTEQGAVMIETAIEIPSPEGAIDGFLIQPEKAGHWPRVLYLTYIVGIDDSSRSMARRLAAEGYAVLLPNIFYRSAKPPIFNFPYEIGDERFVQRMNEVRGPLTPDAMDRDLSAYVDFLARQPGIRARAFGVVGFGFSARMALRAAATRPDEIVAAASFDGIYTDAPHTLLSNVKARLYFGPAETAQSWEASARCARPRAAVEVASRSAGCSVSS